MTDDDRRPLSRHSPSPWWRSGAMTNGGTVPASNGGTSNEGPASTCGDTRRIVGSHRSYCCRLVIFGSLAAVLALAVSLGVVLSKRNASAGDPNADVVAAASDAQSQTRSTPSSDAESTGERPNVLFISIDDLNTWVGYTGRNPQTKTPNIDRLSSMGVSFTNAHAASPLCNPSRTAVWSGIRPHVSGCYKNYENWKKYIPEGMGLNSHFKANGYFTAGRGKTYHLSVRGKDGGQMYASEWDDYPQMSEWNVTPPIHKSSGYFKDVEIDLEDDDDPDWHTVDYCIDQMLDDRAEPFFLACGIYKPHLPWAVPQKYYEMFPLDEIQLPPHREDDLDDVPLYAIENMSKPDEDYAKIMKLGRWKKAIQSYLATIAYADMNIGRLLDAYEKSPDRTRDNTIIVLWSDHGWHFGEKKHFKKYTLWEPASGVPFIWVAPGITKPGTVCHRPVDLMSIYPTLCDLAGLDVPDHAGGDNIRPLLEDPDANWDGVALSTMGYMNHAVRDQHYRYTRYADGSEELYDHWVDDNEFDNLAMDSRYDYTKERLSKYLPPESINMKPWKWGPAWKEGLTCREYDTIIKKCEDGNYVARDPNNYCLFLDCPASVR